ncbi:hypothetical protein D3C87_713720 [compost metagenome]
MNKKIYDVNPEGHLSRFAEYLKTLSEKYGLGFDLQAVPQFSVDLFKDAHAVYIEPSLAEKVFATTALVPSQVRSLGVVDSFFHDEGGWLSRIVAFEALRRVLVSKAKEMDIRSPAFVIGDGEKVRVSTAVLAHLGFADIYVVSENEEALRHNIEYISKSYIGIRFHSLLANALTMQALSAAILINTVDLSQDKALLNDLSYFNFMKREGLVLDYNLEGYPNHSLLEEAERAELKLLDCSELAAMMALLWFEYLNLDVKATNEDLSQVWSDSLKNPPSV